MSRRKTLSMEAMSTTEILCALFNECGDDIAFANRFLSNPIIKREFKEHLKSI
jgi:hypothetical protein